KSRAGGAWWHGRVFCIWFLSVLARARSYQGIPQVPGRISTQRRNDEGYANWTRRNFHIDPGCRHNFRIDASRKIGHCGRCALRRSHWQFRGLRICAAQLREPEHRPETRSGTGCGLLRPVDYHRHSHRSYLQTPRYTIIVNISIELIALLAWPARALDAAPPSLRPSPVLRDPASRGPATH